MTDQAQALRDLMQKKTEGKKAPNNGKTRIITVASGKGGVGKTSVSVNLGIAYARAGKKVIILDADLGLANINIMLDIVPKYNLIHVIKRQKTMKEIIVDTNYGVKIIAGASGISRVANIDKAERDYFINELASLSQADIIIIDTSAGISENVLSFVAVADDAIIITTPEPTSITDAYGIIKIISTDMENFSIIPKLVVNKASGMVQARKVAERIINISGQFLNFKVDYIGCIYEDPLVPQSIIRQVPFIALNPKSKASLSIFNLMSTIEKEEIISDKGLGKLIKKLFSSN